MFCLSVAITLGFYRHNSFYRSWFCHHCATIHTMWLAINWFYPDRDWYITSISPLYHLYVANIPVRCCYWDYYQLLYQHYNHQWLAMPLTHLIRVEPHCYYYGRFILPRSHSPTPGTFATMQARKGEVLEIQRLLTMNHCACWIAIRNHHQYRLFSTLDHYHLAINHCQPGWVLLVTCLFYWWLVHYSYL